MGFLSSEMRPARYSSSLIPVGSGPGDVTEILSEYISILICAFISHSLWTSAFATVSRKAFSGTRSTLIVGAEQSDCLFVLRKNGLLFNRAPVHNFIY